jgi:hypothetical protein
MSFCAHVFFARVTVSQAFADRKIERFARRVSYLTSSLS